MLKSVTIQSYKSLNNLTVPLEPVTLVVGHNGAGKTAFLEALVGLAGIKPVTWESTNNQDTRMVEQGPVEGKFEEVLRQAESLPAWEVLTLHRFTKLPQPTGERELNWLPPPVPTVDSVIPLALSKLAIETLSEGLKFTDRKKPFRFQNDRGAVVRLKLPPQEDGAPEVVAVAAVIHVGKSQLLVLDEPELHLDPWRFGWLVDSLYALASSGLQVVLVSQNPALWQEIPVSDCVLFHLDEAENTKAVQLKDIPFVQEIMGDEPDCMADVVLNLDPFLPLDPVEDDDDEEEEEADDDSPVEKSKETP